MRPLSILPFVLAVLVSGVSQAFISTPANLVWLHAASFAPAIVVLSRCEGRAAWLGGWLLGASANAAIFLWLMPTVDRFTTLGPAGGVAVLALFALAFGFYGAVFGWGAAAVRRASGRLWPLGLAAWFTACEFLNPQLFPYYQGVAWFQVRPVFLLSALTGVSGVTFLILAWNGLVAAAWEAWRGDDEARSGAVAALRASGAVFAALVIGAAGYTQGRARMIDDAVAGAETRRFALIQANVDVQGMRALLKQGRQVYREDLNSLTRQALASDPSIDVVVWPEGAVRGSLLHPSRAAILEIAREHGVEIWTGVVEKRGPKGAKTRHNGGYRVSPDGTVSPPYDKNILVPFGEYMPGVQLLPFLGKIRNFPNVTAGEQPVILTGPKGPPAGFLVCYEATRPRYLREQVKAGAEILATVTFDGWFGDTAALDQHMMLAASMSAATGLPQVRAATTGISMATGPDGILLGHTERAERTWLIADVPMVALPSPYVRLGDWVAWLSILAGFALAALGRARGAVVPLVFLAAAPLAWAINPHVPWADVLVWGAAVGLALWAVWRTTGRQAQGASQVGV